MVTAPILLGTAATFFSLGGIFCLYIHTLSKSMRRGNSQDLKCGESVENEMCCAVPKEVNCSREGTCGNKTKTKNSKHTDEDEYSSQNEELELDGTISDFSDDNENSPLKLKQQRRGSDTSNVYREFLEEMEQKKRRGESESLQSLKSIKSDISLKDQGREEGTSSWMKRKSYSKMENIVAEPVQKKDSGTNKIIKKQKQSISKNEGRKKKQKEKEEKKKLEKQKREIEKENKKKLQQEKKKKSEEEKIRKKEKKQLKKNERTKLATKKDEKNKIVKDDKAEVEEQISNTEIEFSNINYQEVRAIFTGKRDINNER